MKKRLGMVAVIVVAAIAAMMHGTAAHTSAALEADETVHVIGEKLDSGLGSMVYGESLDDGLGTMVYGEKLDSGLGELTAADLQQYLAPAAVQTASVAR
jgi:hypothetical protein